MSASSLALTPVLDDRHLAAPRQLLRPQGGDDRASRLVGPVGARLDHSAGGQRPHGDVRTKDQQFIVAGRGRELQVGILPALDAAGERDTQPECQRQARLSRRVSNRHELPSTVGARPPPNDWDGVLCLNN